MHVVSTRSSSRIRFELLHNVTGISQSIGERKTTYFNLRLPTVILVVHNLPCTLNENLRNMQL